jgi:hypothetical protein
MRHKAKINLQPRRNGKNPLKAITAMDGNEFCTIAASLLDLIVGKEGCEAGHRSCARRVSICIQNQEQEFEARPKGRDIRIQESRSNTITPMTNTSRTVVSLGGMETCDQTTSLGSGARSVTTCEWCG